MAIAELVMPKMGESIMEATILHWHKKVGDPISQDETVLDIATDKVDSEIPSTVSGIITELLFNVNDVVPVGSVIARIEVVDSLAEPVQSALPSAYTPPTPEHPQYIPSVAPPQPAITAGQPVPYVPQSAPTSRPPVGNNRFFSPLVLNIANSEGLSLSELERITGTGADGRVSKKDIILYITDKKAGNIAPFIPLQHQPTYNQTPVNYQGQPKTEYDSQPVPPAQTNSEPLEETAQPHPVYTVQPAETDTLPKQPDFSPVIESAHEQKLHTQPLQPVQKEFRRSQLHVANAASESQTISEQEPIPFIPEDVAKPDVEIIEMDRMRKLIAKHMVESKHISAHVTSFAEADVTNMVTWRNRIKHDFEQKAETKITFTPMFIECLIKVMKRFPIINSSVIGDTIAIKSAINIGMATALPDNNLIVPVIKHAESMGLVGLAKSVNSLADNARHNKLKPEDIQESTFTFTNIGTFGSLMGTPIINQPQVAILAVGVIKKRPVVIETESGDFIGIRHMIYLSLSYDHRIIDGSVGSSFLSAVAKEFENWDVSRELKLIVKEQYVD
jgi:2-oxoglutarate dehydrogenase E2 component (dihydrolipoamide succinyltransferase)